MLEEDINEERRLREIAQTENQSLRERLKLSSPRAQLDTSINDERLEPVSDFEENRTYPTMDGQQPPLRPQYPHQHVKGAIEVSEDLLDKPSPLSSITRPFSSWQKERRKKKI